jgi:hypothetical protein
MCAADFLGKNLYSTFVFPILKLVCAKSDFRTSLTNCLKSKLTQKVFALLLLQNYGKEGMVG